MPSIQAIPYVPGRARGRLYFGLHHRGPDTIVVVPGGEIRHLRGRPAAVIAVDAAPFSHFMIRLLSAGIPTVIIARRQTALLHEKVDIAVDGTEGVICDPDLLSDEYSQAPSPPRAGIPVNTEDGVPISLNASVSGSDGAALAFANGATAIGLVRSEYLAPATGSPPDAAFFEAAFKGILSNAGSLPVRVRLLDLAADKRPGWYRGPPVIPSALGLHGARLFESPSVRRVVKAQAQALAHIPCADRLSLLLPAVTRPSEFDRLRETVRRWLPETTLGIGAMAENPAALLALPELLARCPFAAVGCNDLMQYLFAADRNLDAVTHLVDPYAPGLYRLLGAAAQYASERLDEVQFCGLLAQLPAVLPLLIGLGIRQFSVEPVMLPWLAKTIRSTRAGDAVELVDAVCRAHDSGEVRRLLGLGQEDGWKSTPDYP